MPDNTYKVSQRSGKGQEHEDTLVYPEFYHISQHLHKNSIQTFYISAEDYQKKLVQDNICELALRHLIAYEELVYAQIKDNKPLLQKSQDVLCEQLYFVYDSKRRICRPAWDYLPVYYILRLRALFAKFI